MILKQQARIERLRIELKSEKAKLVIMKQEIDELEKNRLESEINLDMEKQLIREIKHLRYQCKELELDGKYYLIFNKFLQPIKCMPLALSDDYKHCRTFVSL